MLLVVIAGISWLLVLLQLLLFSHERVQSDRWIAPHLAVRTFFDCFRWSGRVIQLVLLKRVGVPSQLRFRGWEIYDDRLQYMSGRDASLLDQSLGS